MTNNNKKFIVYISTVPKNVELKIGLIEQKIHEYIEQRGFILDDDLNEYLADVLPDNTYIIHDTGTLIVDIDDYTTYNFHIVEKADTKYELDASEINYMLPKDTKFDNIGCTYTGTNVEVITIPALFINSTDAGSELTYVNLCRTILQAMQSPIPYEYDVELLFHVNNITVKTENGEIKEFSGSDIHQEITRIDNVQCAKRAIVYNSSGNMDMDICVTLDTREKTLQIETNYIDKFQYQQIESVTLTLIIDNKGERNEEFICHSIINEAAQKISESLSGKQMLSYVTGLSGDVIEKRIREYIREKNILVDCSGNHIKEALSTIGIIKKTFRD